MVVAHSPRPPPWPRNIRYPDTYLIKCPLSRVMPVFLLARLALASSVSDDHAPRKMRVRLPRTRGQLLLPAVADNTVERRRRLRPNEICARPAQFRTQEP